MFGDRILLVLGVGYLAACLRILTDGIAYLRRRSTGLLTWPVAPPPYYRLRLGIGATSGLLLFVAVFLQRWAPAPVFGMAMMCLYYSCAVPCSLRIARGFYEEGIWAEKGFMPYETIGGFSWRGERPPTLVLISGLRNLARRLVVPVDHYAEARRLLRDKIDAQAITLSGTGLDLGLHDRRDDV